MTQDRSSALKMLRRSLGVLGIVLAAGPLAANAQGWYVGAGVGQTKVKEDLGCDIFSGSGVACNEDDSDTAFKVFAGYGFNPNAAVEFGYVDLGKATLDASDGIDTLTLDWESSGIEIAVVGTVPVASNFALLGRVGFFNWDVDAKVGGTFLAGSVDESGTDLTFGVGVRFDVSKSVALRAEWQRFSDVGDNDTTGQSDVDMLSASLVVNL